MIDFLLQFSIYISNIFSPWMLLLLNLFLLSLSIVYLNIKRIPIKELFSVNCPNGIKGLMMIFISLLISGVLSQIVKISFRIPRPEGAMIEEIGYSFISAHSAMSFALAFTCIYLVFKYYKDHRDYINVLHSAFFLSWASMIAYSRIMLQVHRVIDIFGGLIIGLISVYLSIIIYFSTIKYVNKKIFK